MVSWLMRRKRLLLSVMTLSGTFALGSYASADCEGLLPPQVVGAAGSRAITALDLVELRDIGPSDASVMGISPLALSPDGKELAFILTSAEVKLNIVCRGVVVVGLVDGRARLIDTGGEPIFNSGPLRGLEMFDGALKLVRPVWSPDGQWVAYKRRDHGVIQAWRARADGSRAEQVTHSQADVVGMAWSNDGSRLIVATHPDQAKFKTEFDQEATSGWLYDARIIPNISPRPQMPAPLPEEVTSISLADGAGALASEADALILRAAATADDELAPKAQASNGARAWTERVGTGFFAPSGLKVMDARKRQVDCPWEMCRGKIVGLWWDKASSALIFLRREGWQYGSMGLYRWRPGKGGPHRILATGDVLTGCIQAGAHLICDSENSKVPRHIVRLDAKTGRQKVIFEPNPEFAQVRLGKVQRLTWKNSFGLPAWGDLVLPPDYQPGQHLPLIVVQYHSDGFLRGGTGDEYPIFRYAEQGFAVLSLERPPLYALSLLGMTTVDRIIAANQQDWSERRSLLSSLQTGVEKVVAMGIADPARMGITGLSDGATTARFAMINYPVFAAAAISTCCLEPHTAMTNGGIAWADWQHDKIGIPLASENRPDFWKSASISLNADKIEAPLLMQLADKEFQLSLEAFTALREAGKPVEMYIFPDEEHVKGQPVHRLNVYNRNLDWFAFWLQGKKDADPAKAVQYARWEKMKAARDARLSPAAANPTSVPTLPRQPDP